MPGKLLRLALLWVLGTGYLACGSPLRAQVSDPWGSDPQGGFFGGVEEDSLVTVSAEFTVPTEDRPAGLFVTATVSPGWHIYSMTQPEGGPLPTKISVGESDAFELAGDFRPSPPPHRGKEPAAFGNLPIESHEGTVTWHVPIKLAKGVDPKTLQIVGELSGLACKESCKPIGPIPFVASLGSGGPIPVAEPAPQESAPPVSIGKLAWILGLAFLGGLILNLMPCVLPVISLKLFAFIEQGGQSRARIFMLNVWFTAGLLLVFLVLAALSASASLGLSEAGEGLDWGEQFTFTWFKVALTALVFVMALAFLGVWEIPIPGFIGSGKTGELQSKEGVAGAFFKGVFTTILATPCIGPFLGSVFGFTLDQPAYVAFLIFGTAGLGMASPYLLIGAFPQFIRFLPKPGAWMETLKQVMGFLLLGTVVYLFSSIAERYFIPTLTLLVGLWFACWLIGRTPWTATGRQRAAAWLGGIATAALIGVLAFNVLLHEPIISWKEFSPRALDEARAQGKTVMVDFTANWCPNCKVNLIWAIDTEEVNEVIQANDVVPLLADWTDRSPMIKESLRRLKRRAIPVLAIWPAGADDDEVIILDGALMQSQVLEALEKAGPSEPATPSG